jgi:hypothetical protein
MDDEDESQRAEDPKKERERSHFVLVVESEGGLGEYSL